MNKVRLSVSEGLGCPFLKAGEIQEDIQLELQNIKKQENVYEGINESMSRLESIRDNHMNAVQEEYQEYVEVNEPKVNKSDTFNAIDESEGKEESSNDY